MNPSSSSASLFSNALLRSSNLNLNPASHPSGVPDDVLASPTPYAPDPATYGTLYKFTSVFPSGMGSSSTALVSPTSPTFTAADRKRLEQTESQAAFFRSTTLPLVRDFLKNGENCLLFAYGSTGSGKTYTVQGGVGEDAGLLPRVVDVVWKSLEAKVRSFSFFSPFHLLVGKWETDFKGGHCSAPESASNNATRRSTTWRPPHVHAQRQATGI